MSADRDSVERLIQHLRAEADIDKREGGFSWDLHRASATMLSALLARCEAAEAELIQEATKGRLISMHHQPYREGDS